jgi:Protein of unknown function (DUF2939)
MAADDTQGSVLQKDRDLADGIRRIRQAVEGGFGRALPSADSVTASEECDAIIDAIYDVADKQQSSIARNVALCSVLFVLLLSAYAAWPLIGLYRLASAVEAHNAALLNRLIDFPSLRRSVTEQVVGSYLQLTGKDAGLSTFARAVAVGTAANIFDPVVARAFNSESIADFLSKGSSVEGVSVPPNTAPITTASLRSAWTTWLDSEYSFRDFYVRLPPHTHPAEKFRLTLRLTAWKWRLTGIDLPERLRIQLAQEVIRSEERR